MARNKVRLDMRGLEELATNTQFKDAMREAGEAVAANVRAMGIAVDGVPGDVQLPVRVDGPDDTRGFRSFDRAKVRVTITHPSGLAVQAKHGALTKAAAQAGLDVRGA